MVSDAEIMTDDLMWLKGSRLSLLITLIGDQFDTFDQKNTTFIKWENSITQIEFDQMKCIKTITNIKKQKFNTVWCLLRACDQILY